MNSIKQYLNKKTLNPIKPLYVTTIFQKTLQTGMTRTIHKLQAVGNYRANNLAYSINRGKMDRLKQTKEIYQLSVNPESS